MDKCTKGWREACCSRLDGYVSPVSFCCNFQLTEDNAKCSAKSSSLRALKFGFTWVKEKNRCYCIFSKIVPPSPPPSPILFWGQTLHINMRVFCTLPCFRDKKIRKNGTENSHIYMESSSSKQDRWRGGGGDNFQENMVLLPSFSKILVKVQWFVQL